MKCNCEYWAEWVYDLAAQRRISDSLTELSDEWISTHMGEPPQRIPDIKQGLPQSS